jgi:DNA excision repair protein ERCC-6
LITRGAIEEKVYHRQIYKHALSTRILNDPRQKRYVASRDLRDLFSLSDRQHGNSSETGRIFRGVSHQVTAGDLASDSDADEPMAHAAAAAAHDVVLGNGDNGAAVPAPLVDAAPAEASSEQRQSQRPGARAKRRRTDGADAAQESQRDGEADDATILKELFGGEGLHSALNHSAIELSSDPAKRDVEQHASKVAERAVEALRASRAAVRREAVSTCVPKSGSFLAWC